VLPASAIPATGADFIPTLNTVIAVSPVVVAVSILKPAVIAVPVPVAVTVTIVISHVLAHRLG
jgi:K+ transporter